MSRLTGNPRIKALIIEVVENQVRDNDPPETKQTYDRLIMAGYSEEEAKRLIGSVVAIEVFGVLRKKEVFNLRRFVQALERLPDLPIARGSDQGTVLP